MRRQLFYVSLVLLTMVYIIVVSWLPGRSGMDLARHSGWKYSDDSSKSRDSQASIVLQTDHIADRGVNSIPIVDSQKSPLEVVNFESKKPVGNVLIVRGILTVFSLGLNQIGQDLHSAGYNVRVVPAIKSAKQAIQIRNELAKSTNDQNLIIIGHSLGGDLAPKLARIFQQRGIDVDLLIMLDSTMPSSPPANVKRCINLYQTNNSPDWAPLFRGSEISAESERTELFNIDIRDLAPRSKTARINHFNIDTNRWVQNLIVRAVQNGSIAGSEQELRSQLSKSDRPVDYARTENEVIDAISSNEKENAASVGVSGEETRSTRRTQIKKRALTR